MEQRTNEWFQARCGKATASRIADAIARTKTGWGASRANYMAELIAERLTGSPAERFTNAAMQWGVDTEGEARMAYGLSTGDDVIEVGFIDHPALPMSGASPDGFVGDLGLVEIKCPNTATHIETLIGQTIPSKYETQMLWQMACTGRRWCDFVSYDPRMPDDMRLFVRRFHGDGAEIARLETEVRVFLAEVEAKQAQLIEAIRRRAA
jgi:putative phage-type endonuclease